MNQIDLLNQTRDIRKFVKRNFIIRYSYREDEKQTFLISPFKYMLLVGEKTALRHFSDLNGIKVDKHTVKLRRGIKIDFVSK